MQSQSLETKEGLLRMFYPSALVRKEKKHPQMIFELFRLAMDTNMVLKISYVREDGQQAERLIEPHELNGGLFLSWDRLRGNWRTFYPSRCLWAEWTGDCFVPREIVRKESQEAPWTNYLQMQGDFTEIRLWIHDVLSDEEVEKATRCFAEAVKTVAGGNEISSPSRVYVDSTTNLSGLTFVYDSTTASEEADFIGAFNLGKRYIYEGTPARTRNTASGPKGSRKFYGIGRESLIEFYVR